MTRKETIQLPDWVKVGATVFCKQDKKLCKITEIHPNYIETEMIKESGRTVRLQDPNTFLNYYTNNYTNNYTKNYAEKMKVD